MNHKIESSNYRKLFQLIFDLYHLEENKEKLLFHGWHHIKFVHDKAIEFAVELNADLTIVASAALVHDLNYVFTNKLEPEAAMMQVKEYLIKANFNKSDCSKIEGIVSNMHLGYRDDRTVSNETKALADADTLFKILPTTPILFAPKFITQNKYVVEKLANKVVDEHEHLMLSDNYFYTKSAKKKYWKWARSHLGMWKNVLEAMEDRSIREMLENARELGVL